MRQKEISSGLLGQATGNNVAIALALALALAQALSFTRRATCSST